MSLPPPPNFSLQGKHALVTGSSRGIGLALATALGQSGAKVVLNGRDQAALKSAGDQLQSAGIETSIAPFDVTRESEVQQAAREISPIDILVNNAGIQRRSPLVELSLRDWQAVLDTNLTSAFLVSRSFAPAMIEQQTGKIINICSLMSELARPTIANYSAAKGGLKMLTRSMCAEWAQYNIQINGISPGYIATELTAPLQADPKFDAWVKQRTPAERWGDVTDLTGAVVFMASDAAQFLNGQVLTIDGGLSAVV